ncbi:MAG TPA: hypothetical protein VHP83_24835 [Aggregatilineaceae bacterium]|nr:hypothetical protein [Aggregatilineaceae bacterium]
MFKRLTTCALLLLAFVFSASTSTTTTRAQDDMPKITCDSTLVTLLYIAEYDYGFHSMSDVSQLEKGPYTSLFDSMMMGMEEDEMMEGTPEADMMAEDEMMEGTPEADMMAEGDMMALAPGVVTGEDQFCTTLRAELESFFYDYFSQEMMSE